MSVRVDSTKIEAIVGAERHPVSHIARAVSDEQMVYILHSQHCLDQEIAGIRDLSDCPYSLALDEGIDVAEWIQDEPVRVAVSLGRLVPYEPGKDE
jgi:hypothetical protein